MRSATQLIHKQLYAGEKSQRVKKARTIVRDQTAQIGQVTSLVNVWQDELTMSVHPLEKRILNITHILNCLAGQD